MVIAYALLFLFGSTPQLPFSSKYSLNLSLQGTNTIIVPSTGMISDDKLGGICLFLAVGLSAYRKNIARRYASYILIYRRSRPIFRILGDVGTKRMLSLSSSVAAGLLLPVAIYQLVIVSLNALP